MDLIEGIQKIDDSLDRDRHTHSADYRGGWDDAIDKVMELISSIQKPLDKPDSEGWYFYLIDDKIATFYFIKRHEDGFWADGNSYEYPVEDYSGKWVKAIAPGEREWIN